MANASQRSERRITLSATYQASAKGGGRTVPMLRMRGDWLQQLGFKRGTRVVVAIEANQLVVRPE